MAETPEEYLRRILNDPLYLHCGTCCFFAKPQHGDPLMQEGYCEAKDSPTFADWPTKGVCLHYVPITEDGKCK